MLCAEDLLALANYVLNMYFCSKRSRWLCSHGMLAEGSHVGAMRWQLCMHHALLIPRHKINETRSPALPRNLLPGRLVHIQLSVGGTKQGKDKLTGTIILCPNKPEQSMNISGDRSFLFFGRDLALWLHIVRITGREGRTWEGRTCLGKQNVHVQYHMICVCYP